jgi:hypothetical protein
MKPDDFSALNAKLEDFRTNTSLWETTQVLFEN